MNLLNKSTLLTLVGSLISFFVIGQIPVGSWRDHLPYNNGQVIALSEDRVYCATDLALFYYNLTDNAIYKLSKINKLSDLEVGYIAYSEKHKKLIIGYLNGNIDVLENDTKYNFPDIKLKNIIADKSIYHILVQDDFAYLSTGFGIVVFNLQKNEFADTYIIGSGGSYMKINNTAIYNNYIYALTDNGVYKGDLDDPFLGNFENWEKVSELLYPDEAYHQSAVFNNSLLLVNNYTDTNICMINQFDGQSWDTLFALENIKSMSVNDNKLAIAKQWHVNTYDTNFEKIGNYSAHDAQYAIYDKDDNLWIADSKQGMLMHNTDIYKKVFNPNGPANSNVFKVFYNNGDILVAPGGHTSTGHNTYNHANVYNFTDEQWQNLTDDENNKDTLSSLRDVVQFASQQNSNYYMAAAWNYGLLEVENDIITKVYNSGNTDGILSTNIGGLTYDRYGNLYIVSNLIEKPFIVKTPENNWYSYSYNSRWAYGVCKLINTNNNDKWAISSRGNGVFVWNDNYTPEYEADDIYKSFDLKDDANKIIDKRLNDIVEDIEGVIWIATSNGVAVYDYPQYALRDDYNFYARVPQIVVDGYLKGLLEGENVTTIAVDGANRKWLGTEGGGLFLVSADGTEQLMIWNTDNSKLLSNNIISVDINQKTGEVFIGTNKGMQSYKSTSSENRVDYSDIYTFPNPVKGDYNGVITIRGLMYQTNVKITDISGNLVFETLSNGGDAIWNGKDLTGNKVAPGIYLVMCSLPDGSQSEASKILFIK